MVWRDHGCGFLWRRKDPDETGPPTVRPALYPPPEHSRGRCVRSHRRFYLLRVGAVVMDPREVLEHPVLSELLTFQQWGV